jgi:uncharacterized protein YjbJ (UPF0337 family)
MNQTNDKQAVNGTTPPAQTGTPEPVIRVPTLGDKSSITPIPAKGPSATSLPPIGNAEIIIKQQSMPSVDELKGKWKQQIGAAKIAWGELTEDELLKSEGHQQKLAGLVQERYAVTRDEADKQIKAFFAKHKS